MKRLYFLAACIILSSFIVAATPVSRDFSVKRFNVQNGLPSNRINHVAQDPNGFIWFATSNGLVRFDGNEFFDYYSKEQTRDIFYKDEVKGLDINGDEILLIHDDYAELFNQRTGDVRLISDSLLVGNNLKAGKILGDGILLGGIQGLFMYNIPEETIEQIVCLDEKDHNTLRSVRSIFVDNTSTVWIATSRHGVYSKAPGTEQYSRADVLPANCFATSFASKDGFLYLATWDDGIYTLHSDSRGVGIHRLDTKSLGWSISYSISFDENGNLWVGTPDGIKVVSFDGSVPALIPVEQETGVERAREVKYTFVDGYGNVWYTDQGNGVAKASYASDVVREINFLKYGLKYSEVTAIHVNSSNVLWAGINGSGLVRFDLNSGELLKEDRVLSGISNEANGIVSIRELPGTGQIMLCTRYDGVYFVRMKGEQPVSMQHVDVDRKGFRNNFTIGSEKASGNDAWVATTKGVVLLHYVDGSFECIEPLGLNSLFDNDQVETILNDSTGKLWIATRGHGLFRVVYDYINGTPVSSSKYLVGGLSNSETKIQCLYEDSHHNIWAGGSRTGLMLFDEVNDCFKLAENNESLPSDCISSIVEDAKGMLWISTDCGFACYDLSSDSKVVVSSRMDRDMENVTFLPRSVWYGNGMVMFGGYRGISICNPGRILRNELVAPPVVTEISMPDNSFDAIDALPPFTTKLRVRHNQRDINLKFASICKNPERLIYAYRLGGVDKGWKYLGARESSVNYVNLKPGHYSFHVKASPAPGKWTDETVLKIRVKCSPLILYLALLSLVVLFMIGALYTYKRKKETAESDLLTFREEVARESIQLTGTDLDKQFIAKVVKVIEENLSNPELDVDFLNSAMNMSNSTLYRKIKSLTGLATKEFIRQTRYKYACKYLLEKSSNISDVAYRVGFANSKYFSQCFKKEFGMTPSQYIQRNKE